MNLRQEAEDSLVGEMLVRHAMREYTGDMTDHIIIPVESVEELRARIFRASLLSPSSMYRAGVRFVKATDPKSK